MINKRQFIFLQKRNIKIILENEERTVRKGSLKKQRQWQKKQQPKKQGVINKRKTKSGIILKIFKHKKQFKTNAKQLSFSFFNARYHFKKNIYQKIMIKKTQKKQIKKRGLIKENFDQQDITIYKKDVKIYERKEIANKNRQTSRKNDKQLNYYNKITYQSILTQIKKDIKDDCMYTILEQKLEKIIAELKKRNYFIDSYIGLGGMAIVLSGFYQDENIYQKEEWAIKITLDGDSRKEAEIMKSIKNSYNAIKYKDSFQLKELNVSVIIMERCMSSLFFEMKYYKENNQNYSFDQFGSIIFQLADSLNELKLHEIRHLDIKLGNVLKTMQGRYLLGDYGISLQSQRDCKKVCSFTPGYASPEQEFLFKNQKNEQDISNLSYPSDIFSLGITFERFLDFYQKQLCMILKENGDQKNKLDRFSNLINDKMLCFSAGDRINCEDLLFEIYNIFGKNNSEIWFYIKQKTRKFPFEQDYLNNVKDLKFEHLLTLCYQRLYLQSSIDKQNLDISVQDIIENKIEISRITDSSINMINYLSQLITISHYYYKTGQLQPSKIIREHCTSIIGLVESGKCEKHIKIIDNNQYCTLLYELANSHLQVNQHDTAIFLQEISIMEIERSFDANNPMLAKCYLQIGFSYCQLKKVQKFPDFYEKALIICKKIYRKYHREELDIMMNIGYYSLNLNQYKIANEYIEKSKIIFQNLSENDKKHPRIAFNYSNLAWYYEQIFDYENALKNSSDCLNIRKAAYFEDHILIAEALVGRGNILRALFRTEDAIKDYLMAIQKYEKTSDKLRLAAAYTYLGLAYQQSGQLKQSKQYFQKSIDLKQEASKGERTMIPTVKISLFYQASLCFSYGQIIEGLGLISKIEQNHQIDSEITYSLAINTYRIAYGYLFQGDADTTLYYSNCALNMLNRLFPTYKDQIDIALCKLCNGKALLLQEKFDNAKNELLDSLRMFNNLYSNTQNHEEIPICLDALGNCYLKQKEYSQSIQKFEESYEIKQKLYPSYHPEIVQSLLNFAQYYQYYEETKDEQKSEFYYKSIAEIVKDYESSDYHIFSIILKKYTQNCQQPNNDYNDSTLSNSQAIFNIDFYQYEQQEQQQQYKY